MTSERARGRKIRSSLIIQQESAVEKARTNGVSIVSEKAEAFDQGPPAAADAWTANPISRWLLTEAWDIASPIDLVTQLALRLTDSGIALLRLRVIVRTLHPLAFGRIFSWSRDTGRTEELSPSHDVLETTAYRDSPIAAVFDGAQTIRRQLSLAEAQLDFPYLKDLVNEGATDYVAMPIVFTDGQINAVTLVSDGPGGFQDIHLKQFNELLPALARLMELHSLRHFSKTLLETYLGKFTGERVLDGLIKRGDGDKIHAVLWFSDLRDSTPMAEAMTANEFLPLLNSFFDCMAGAVLDHGGEVLSFVGDGVLAIFPISCNSEPLKQACMPQEKACASALEAARDARDRLEQLNEQRQGQGEPRLEFGLGLHVGKLVYGNIGVPERLQFTVIGAAVNQVVRLQDLTRELDHAIVASSAFSACVDGPWRSLGHYGLRGVSADQEIFALASD